MSWWDTSGITNLASQALKNAQEKIDKVLEIKEGESAKKKGLEPSHKIPKKEEEELKEVKQDGDFWSSWLGSGGRQPRAGDNTAASSHSSWNNPWSLAGSSSEQTDATDSKKATPPADEMSEAELHKSDPSTLTSEASPLTLFPQDQPKSNSSTAEAIETKPQLTTSEKSHVLSYVDMQGTYIEQKEVLPSDSFTTDWQDFPLDSEALEPGEDSPVDRASPALQDNDNESSQNIDDKIDLMPFAETKLESAAPYANTGDLGWSDTVFGVEAEADSRDLEPKTNKKEESSSRMQSVDNSSDAINNLTLNASTVRPSSIPISMDNDSTQTQTLLQEFVPVQKSFLPPDNSVLLDDSRELDLKHFDISSKNFSSSSFIAVSDEIVAECSPSDPSSTPIKDTHPQGTTTSTEEIQTKLTEPVVSAEYVSELNDQEHPWDESVLEYLGDESVQGHPDDESVQGHPGDESVQGHPDDESVQGHPGDESVQGHPGDESVQGHPDDESVQGHLGDESVQGHPVDESVQGHPGDESVQGHQGDESVQGHPYDESVQGHQGDESVQGHPVDESVQGHPDDESVQGHPDDESVQAISDTSKHEVSEFPDMTGDSGATVKHELPDNIETVLPEFMMSSDNQRYQSDFMQEYVNVSAVTDSNQAVSFEGSAILSDDLHNSNDMGNSRTSSDLDLPGGGRASSTGSSDTSKFDSSIDTVVDRSVLDSQSDIELMDRDPPYSLFDDGQAEDNEIGSVVQLGQLDDSSHSLSSSYVKCMIEEAMEDLSKTEDSGSDNHSNGEKSESSKVDSELEKSVYSGHESSDEIETTTSSDIEIISAPTPNGDNKYHIPFDLSPLKIALQRSSRDQGHNRSDSQSSSSAHSKAGEMDRMSPERGDGASWRDDDYHHHDLHAVREEGADNPSHPERLLKLAQLVVQRKLLGGQKLAEMAEVLQARENKLVQLSKENHQLTEDNNILRNQLQQSEDNRELENADLTALTEEFAVRIGDSEKKIQAIIKEKEMLKQKLTSADKELERRSANSGLQDLLEEKKLQVEELMKEGEKLSMKEHQSGIIIKKLRAKEKECDTTIAAQKKKLEEQTKELERLTAVLDSKEDMEKKRAEAINQLNAAVQRQEKELLKHRSDLEDAQEKCRGLQVALDNSYKEIAELHRSNASQDSKAQEAALSAETHVREELKAAMEREQQRFRQDRETFIMQIDDLRMDMTRLEKEHSRREDLLRQEITYLQERQQQDEARSQDLTHSVSSATRPLLRQIENLQATLGAQSAAWERVEKNLTDRLAEAQTALAMAQEKERTANDHLMELSARVASLEAANTRIKQERARLAAQVESDRSRLEELQDVRNSVVAELESGKQRMSQELSQLKMDKVYLESQLNVERTRLENERKKALTLEEQLRQAELPQSRGTPSPSPSMSVSRQESMAGSMYEHPSPGNMSWSFHEDNESVSTFAATKTSVYDSLRQSGAAVVFENLSSQLKLREGEITHMQSEISQLERTRESMARELVNLSNQNDELLEMKQSHEQLQEQFNELNNRYSAILQMYGEKEEQVQELRLDLQDVKEMYKSQIDALLAK